MFEDVTQELAWQMTADGYWQDFILAIAGTACSHLERSKLLHIVNVKFYAEVDQRLNMPEMLPPGPDASAFSDAWVRIADDIADTRATLELTKKLCEKHVAEVRCAVILEKPRSQITCEDV